MNVAVSTRLALIAAAVCLGACSGLDPRRLQRLEYGMDQRLIAERLEEPSIPVMRFFAKDEAGREQDVLIELYEGAEEHANYALVSIDGRLASVSIASGSHFLEGQWWRDPSLPLQELVESAAARRLELAWEKLEPIDSSHPSRGRYTAIGMATVLVVPLVIYVPYYVWNELFVDDGFAHAVAMRTFLLEAPRHTTVEQVVAVLGPPTSDREYESEGRPHRALTHELDGGFTIETGFTDGRLLWADFGSWYDWSPGFMRK